jgi:hypothetical protein
MGFNARKVFKKIFDRWGEQRGINSSPEASPKMKIYPGV